MASSELPFDAGQVLGVLLISILLNAYLFGVICQQLYSYWISRFGDPVSVKIFVVTQFIVIVVQGAMLWDLAWNVYIVSFALITNPKSVTWQAVLNSSCQLVLIMMANSFLVARIYSLTRSRLQSGLVLLFSTVAFIVGIVSLATTWNAKAVLQKFTAPQQAESVIWHASQAIAECLIMFFLARALLASRTGLKKSDSLVRHLLRNVVQIGLFATIWAVAALVTYFFLPKRTFYTLFDMTSGSIYTHMIFDGLLSRTRLRSNMAERSEFEVGFPAQSLSHTSPSRTLEGKRLSGAARMQGAVSLVTTADFATASQDTSDPPGNDKELKDANSELEGEPAGKPGAGYDLPV